jgi:hypothetical protein
MSAARGVAFQRLRQALMIGRICGPIELRDAQRAEVVLDLVQPAPPVLLGGVREAALGGGLVQASEAFQSMIRPEILALSPPLRSAWWRANSAAKATPVGRVRLMRGPPRQA